MIRQRYTSYEVVVIHGLRVHDRGKFVSASRPKGTLGWDCIRGVVGGCVERPEGDCAYVLCLSNIGGCVQCRSFIRSYY